MLPLLGTIRVYPWPPVNYATRTKPLNASSSLFNSSTVIHNNNNNNNSNNNGSSSVSVNNNNNNQISHHQADPYYEIFTHGGPVIAIKLSPVVDNTVITVAADGTVFILEDIAIQGKANNAKKDIDYLDASDEIKFNDDIVMIASEDMEEHISELVSLQKELVETKAKHEFNTRKVYY